MEHELESEDRKSQAFLEGLIEKLEAIERERLKQELQERLSKEAEKMEEG